MNAVDVVASTAAVAASIGGVGRALLDRRLRFAGLVLLLLGWLVLLVAIAPESLRAPGAIAIVVASALGWVLAPRLLGREQWLLAAGAALLAVRVPVPTGGGDSAMLLGPLYALVAIGSLVLLRGEWRSLRDPASDAALPDHGGATRLLDIGAAALPVVGTLSLTWSIDRDASAEALACFLLPFLIAYALVRAWVSSGSGLRPAAAALVTSGAAIALVGLLQAASHRVWWNPKVIDANRFRPDFRTNSLFWDPNIYGRVLVLAIVAIVAWLLANRGGRASTARGFAAIALLAAALWNTYSQSSWFALAAALLAIGTLTLPPPARRGAAIALAVLLAISVPIALERLEGDDTEGRAQVVRTGIALAGERPLLGWGIGTFELAARERSLEQGQDDPRLSASHTTPITVLAELGVLGAVAYLTLLASATTAVLARWRRSSSPAAAARARGEDGAPTGWPVGPILWATGALVALFAHSLLYAGFFEDATLWVALAVLASLPRASDLERGDDAAGVPLAHDEAGEADLVVTS